MRSDPELVARQVPCPLCKVVADSPCINTTTRRPFHTGTVHRERVTAAWRKAVADRNKALRNQRGKRPAPPITGIRKAPG